MNSTTDGSAKPCQACGGLGYQYNRVTGINEKCPLCGGSGLNLGGKDYIIC